MPASMRIRLMAMLVCSSVLGNITIAQSEKLPALLTRAPSVPNAMVYMNTPSLKKLIADSGIPLNLSDNVIDVYAVANLDLVTLTPTWEAGYAAIGQAEDADGLAKAVDGYVDVIGDKKVVWTPAESYLVPIDQNEIGFVRPAQRSLAADWINSEGSQSAPKYLASEAVQPEQFLSLMLAFDLHDSYSPIALEERAKEMETLKGKDYKALAEVLSTVRGLSIIIGRKSLNECILSVEFGQSPAILRPFAAELLNEILNYNGTAAPEVKDWQVSLEGNKIKFQGPISIDSLDGLLGIFSVRDHAKQVSERVAASENPPAESGGGGDSQVITASKKYFDDCQCLYRTGPQIQGAEHRLSRQME